MGLWKGTRCPFLLFQLVGSRGDGILGTSWSAFGVLSSLGALWALVLAVALALHRNIRTLLQV